MKFHTTLLSASAIAIAALAAQPASATVMITSSLTDDLAGTAVSFDSEYMTLDAGLLSPGEFTPGSPFTVGDATVSIGSSSDLVVGGHGNAADPVMASGPTLDPNAYLAAEPGSAVTISYADEKKEFGLLWGSVDQYNLLTFENCSAGSCTTVATVDGSQVVFAPGFTSFGDQGFGGSTYVEISGFDFNTVVATSTSPAFEFDFVTSASVPEPASWAMMLAGFGALGFMMRGSRRKDAFAAA